MFGDTVLQGKWLDGAFFNVLHYIDNFFIFFRDQTNSIAKVCLALAIGIGVVKILFQGEELKQFLVKLFMSIMSYFIILWAFPGIMTNANAIVGSLAYNAVASQKISTRYDPNKDIGTQEGFEKYFNDAGTDGKGVTVWSINKDATGNQYMNVQITDSKTNIISLNRVFIMVIGTFKAILTTYTSMYKEDQDVLQVIGKFVTTIPDLIILLFVMFGYVFVISVAIINYAMCMVEFTFLYGVGVIFIPLMLWEGSKQMFTSMISSIYNIAVKLLIIQLVLYLIVLINVDILKTMYTLSVSDGKFLQRMEFYLSVLFMVFFCKVFNDQAEAIAQFLCGGAPRLGMGEFMRGAASTGVAAMAALKVAGKGAKTVGGLAKGTAGVVAGMGAGAKGAFSAEKGAGSGTGTALKAGLQAAGSSLAGSLANGADSAGNMVKNTVKGAPKSLGNAAKLLKYGISPAGSLTSEGVGAAPKNPLSKGGKGQGGEGGGGGGDGGGGKDASGTQGGEEEKNKPKGAGELFQEKMQSDDKKYQGVGGKVRALTSSIGGGIKNQVAKPIDNFISNSSKAAPGYFTPSDKLKTKMAAKEQGLNESKGKDGQTRYRNDKGQFAHVDMSKGAGSSHSYKSEGGSVSPEGGGKA